MWGLFDELDTSLFLLSLARVGLQEYIFPCGWAKGKNYPHLPKRFLLDSPSYGGDVSLKIVNGLADQDGPDKGQISLLNQNDCVNHSRDDLTLAAEGIHLSQKKNAKKVLHC